MNPSADPVTLGMVGDISPYITTIAIYIYISRRRAKSEIPIGPNTKSRRRQKPANDI